MVSGQTLRLRFASLRVTRSRLICHLRMEWAQDCVISTGALARAKAQRRDLVANEKLPAPVVRPFRASFALA